MKKSLRPIRLVTVIAILFTMTACSTMIDYGKSWMTGPPVLRKLEIQAAKDMNGGYPVAVDLVFIKSHDAHKKLALLRAQEWFTGKQDFIRQYPNQLTVLSWELVPGQALRSVALPEAHRAAAGAFIFADYSGTQSFRAEVATTRAKLDLRSSDFELIPQ